MLRRKVLTELGPLDEAYKGEGICGYDLSAALRKMGLELAVAEGAFVHRGRQEFLCSEAEGAEKADCEADIRHYEEKWGVSWKARPYRQGLTREDNLDSLFTPADSLFDRVEEGQEL